MRKALLVIVGPTAIGKTAFAVALAKKYETEIISADSRQLYIEMNIGTASPSAEELSMVKHHFINSHHITENFTASDFEVQSLDTLNKIFEKHDLAILVGGSGMYIHAVCHGFDPLPQTSMALRAKLNQDFIDQGISYLQNQLQQLDPIYFEEIDIKNHQRMIRALEICMTTGRPFSSYRTQQKKIRPFHCIKIGLNTHREQLYHQINARVDHMIHMGLEEEVRSLIAHRYLGVLKTVGYAELFDYLDGKKTFADAVDQIKINTRHLAKRQLTWLKKDAEISWIDAEENSLNRFFASFDPEKMPTE